MINYSASNIILSKIGRKGFLGFIILVLSLIGGSLIALGFVDWKILPVVLAAPIVIAQPLLAFCYIVFEAWVTKNFPLMGTWFIHPVLTPALFMTIYLILYGFASKKFFTNRVIIPKNILNLVVSLFFILIWASALIHTGSINITWFNNFIFYFLAILLLKTDRDFEAVLWTGIAGSTIMALSGFVQLFYEGGIPSNGISGALPNHVQFSWICWMGFVLSTTAYEKAKSSTQKFAIIAIIVVLLTNIVLSLTRSVMLITLITFPFLLPKGFRSKLLLLFPGLILFFFFQPAIFDRLQSLNQIFSLDIDIINSVSSGRLMIYTSAVRMIIANPLIGVGYGNFPKEWSHYISTSDFAISNATLQNSFSAHSSFLQVAAEIGLPGLLFYILIFIFCWKNLRAAGKLLKNKSWLRTFTKSLLIILLGFSIFGLIDNGGWNERYFYLVLALSVSLLQIAQKSNSNIPLFKAAE